MLNAEEQELMQRIGRNPVWQSLLQKRSDAQVSVLKKNSNLEQLCRAQGAVAELDFLQEASRVKQ
jgi:hypothetical protein